MRIASVTTPEQQALEMVTASKEISSLTITEAIKGGVKISKMVAEDSVAFNNVFSALINMTMVSMKVKEKPTPFEIFEFSNKVISEYGFFTIEELGKCFQLGKFGSFGPHYNKFDAETLGLWLSEYDNSEERAEALHRINNSYKSDEIPGEKQFVAASAFKKLHDELLADQRKDFNQRYAERKIQREKFLASVSKLTETASEKELTEALSYLQTDTEAQEIIQSKLTPTNQKEK